MIQKIYIALVGGIIEKDSFTIDAPLGREKKGYKQVVNPVNPRGELRDAVTEVSVLKRYSDTTLVELSPLTGRTHQLRAHMAYICHPIVGDKAYGGVTDNTRVMLHAQKLSFTIGGDVYSFEAEVPSGFTF